MVAAPCLVCWHGEMCPWHRVGVSRFAHDGKPPLLQEVEDLRHVVRRLAATVIRLSGTPRDVATGEAELKGQKSEVVASGMSERHRLATLGVFFRMWTWTNTSTTMERLRRKFG